MKKKLLIALILLPMLTSAQEPVEVKGLNYLLNEEEKTATVTSSNYSGILEIPETIQVGVDEYTVTEIGTNAFSWRNDILSVIIPKTVKAIGYRAFEECNDLISVKLGDGLETIDVCAFVRCRSLQSLTFGENIKTIAASAFYLCDNLNQIYIKDLKKWCMIDFSSEDANPLSQAHHLYLNKKEIKELVIPEGIETVKQYAFSGGTNFTSLVFSSDVSKIGNGAFKDCSSFVDVRFPESLVSIGGSAFQNCSNIEEVDIPDNVTTINENAFCDCSNLEKLKLPSKLQIIKQNAFSGCSKIRSITIPSTVEFIFQKAFSFVSSEPVDFFINPEYPPLAYYDSFPTNSTFYVPEGSIEPYQNVEPWSNMNIQKYSGSAPQKCASPVVKYKNDILSFTSETPDVVFHYSIASADAQKNTNSSLNISGKLLVRVYASKSGYEDSDIIESEIDIRGIKGDLNGDGEVNVADHVKLSDIILNNE